MPRILIVEPYDEIRRLLAAVLRQKGHEVRTTSSGLAALHLMREERFACTIVASPVLIESEGVPARLLELIERERPEWARSIVIVTTQPQDEVLIGQAERLGVCAVFAKPFVPAELQKAVAACARGGPAEKRWYGIPDWILEQALSRRRN